MAISAIELRDRNLGAYPDLTVSPQGMSGRRFYRVNSIDPDEVANLIGAGIPGVGTPWSAQRPTTIATGYSMRCMGGQDTPTSSGLTIVEVQYSPLSLEVGNAAAPVGAKWSEIAVSTQQISAVETVTGTPLPPSAGISAEASVVELKVTGVRANLNTLQTFFGILNRINSNPVDIPGVRGFLGGGFTAQPGELLARGIGFEPIDENRVRAVYTFGLAPLLPNDPQNPGGPKSSAFIRRYRKTDAAGNPTGPYLLADVQGSTAYPAAGVLW